MNSLPGHAVWLMMNMPNYRHVFLSDLEWMVLPPILLNQFRLFNADNKVVAFAAWAYLSEEVEKRLQEPNPRLAPAEWKSGDRLWLIDVFAPFGHTELALKELRETALAGRSFKMHKQEPGGMRRIVEVSAEGASSMIRFDTATIRYDGRMREARPNGGATDVFVVETDSGSFWFEGYFDFAANGYDFHVIVRNFGLPDKMLAGSTNPVVRRKFSAAEAQAARDRITAFFSGPTNNPDLPFVPYGNAKSKYLGTNFPAGWITTS